MNTTKITVNKKDAGTELLPFLASHLGLSKKKAKAMLDSRNVLVNGRRVWMARHMLKEGNIIEALFPESTAQKAKKIKILFQDSDYIIADKIPGILSNGANSVESRLRKELGIKSILSVHRLDKDTSGCLLLAKSKKAFDKAVRVFKEQQIDKSYHAIVSGNLPKRPQTIRTQLEGKQAATSIRVLDSNRNASHLSARIKTGRTHQIRKHLASIQHFVLGDKQYGAGRKLDAKTASVSRQMLHASNLRFTHPSTGKDINVRSPLPPDFRKTLKLFNLK